MYELLSIFVRLCVLYRPKYQSTQYDAEMFKNNQTKFPIKQFIVNSI